MGLLRPTEAEEEERGDRMATRLRQLLAMRPLGHSVHYGSVSFAPRAHWRVSRGDALSESPTQ